MKKIIGIIAAVAMAASVFAAEFTGALKASNSIFNFDGDDVKFLQQNGLDSGGVWWGTRAQITVFADKAGLQFALGAPKRWEAARFENGFLSDWKVWFDPIEQLRINLGPAAGKYKVAGGSEDWQNITRTSDLTVTAEIKPIDGLEIDLGLANTKYVETKTGWWAPENLDKEDLLKIEAPKIEYSYWFDGKDIGIWGLVGKYTAGFGTIGAIVASSGTENNKLKDMLLGLGYDGNIGDNIKLAVDASINVAPKVSNLAADVYFKGSFDALTIAAYVVVSHSLAENAKIGIKPWFRLDYALGNMGVYFRINNDGDYTYSDGFPGIRLEPGITFNVGAAALETSVNLKVPGSGGKFTVDMPFYVTVGF